MKRKLLPLSFMLFATIAFAQDVSLRWGAAIGGTSLDEGRAITTDVSGNVYVAGFFAGTADFDPGSGVSNLTTTGNVDFFIQKLDADGNLLWAKRTGGDGIERAEDVTTDAGGNVYVTGTFEGTVDFDPGDGTSNLTSDRGLSVFVQKLDANGDFLWARSVQSSANGWSITADGDGNVYITGGFTNPLNTDGSTIFLHKLLSNGDMSWEVTMGGPSLEEGQALATDSKGNVYMAGRFSNTVDFDPSINEVNVTSEGGQDIFVQKFNSDGGFLWVRTVGGTSVDQASGIAIDKDDNVYVTGSFERTVDFDPGMGTANLTAIGVEDMFVQKLDSDGNFVWAKQVGGSFVRGRSISTDADGAVYTTGFFRSFTDFDPGAGTFQLNSTGAFDDMFIHKLSADGDFVWAKQLTCSDSEGYGIQIDANNSIYATGFFKGTIDFDPSDKVQTAASNAGSDDIFIVKLNPCSPSAATETVASCGSYTSPSGKLFDASDTYQDTIANTSGCDSVITINLTITSIDTDVNIAGNVLTAATAGATYQWLDCDNGNQPITGETGQSFTATASGNYAVAITENACTDTSDCVNLVVTSVTDNLQAHPLKVFPNPTNGAVHVDFGTITHAAIEVYSIYGQLVFRNGKVSAKVYQFDLDVAAGVYFVKVATEGREMEFKLMKR